MKPKPRTITVNTIVTIGILASLAMAVITWNSPDVPKSDGFTKYEFKNSGSPYVIVSNGEAKLRIYENIMPERCRD